MKDKEEIKMKKYYNNELEIYYVLLKKELERCEGLLAEMNMENIANQNQYIGELQDTDELYNLDDYYLEMHMHSREVYEEPQLKEIIESLGFEMTEEICRIQYGNDTVFFYEGRFWDIDDDIIMEILYNEFHDDVEGACQVIDMLEEKYGWNPHLYWSIRFRDKERKGGE